MNASNVCVNLYATSVWKRELSHVHPSPSLKNCSESQRPQCQYWIILVGATLPNYIYHIIWVWCFSAARQMTKGWDLRSNFSLQASLNVRNPGIRIRLGSCDCHADWQRDHRVQWTGWKQKRIQQPEFAEDYVYFCIDWSTIWCNYLLGICLFFVDGPLRTSKAKMNSGVYGKSWNG